MTFEEFLKECYEKQAEVRMVPRVEKDGAIVRFYAHPNGVNGSTVDYVVTGDIITKL